MNNNSLSLSALCLQLGLAVLLLAGNSPASAQDQQFEELTLNGLSPYVQLRDEYYIGALYLENLNADADAILASTDRKRMQLRITIDKWSPRRFAQQWNQLILINNDQASVNAFADQILAFIDIPREDLIAGDIMTIDRDPDDGTTIYLNDKQVLNVANNDFFTLLLNTWIGQRPPASDFKNAILILPAGQQGTELLTRFQKIKPATLRKRQVAGWFQTPTAPANTQEIDNRPPAVAGPPGSDTRVTAKRVVAPAEQASPTPAAATNPAPAKALIAKPAVAIEAPIITTRQPPAAPQPQPVATTPTPKAADLEAEANALQEKLLDAYRSNILKLAYVNTQYPKRALDFRQEGQVVLKVTINRNGKLVDVFEETASDHRLLNNAARKAITKSAPFPEPPRDLKGDPITLVLPFTFKL